MGSPNYKAAIELTLFLFFLFLWIVAGTVYKEPVFEALTYEIALEHMIQIGYPDTIRGLKARTSLSVAPGQPHRHL